MRLFDGHIVERLKESHFGSESGENLFYKMVGSSDGIALNRDNTGFARVNLLVNTKATKDHQSEMQAKSNEKLLLSSLVSFHFAANSPKMVSVSWSVVKDAIQTTSASDASGSESKSESTAKESLESQTVYPSVVSFDESHRDKTKEGTSEQSHQRPEQQTSEPMDEPGMSI